MLALSNASLRRSSLPSEKALPIPLLITLSYGLRTQRIRFDPFLPFVLFVYGLSAHRQFRMRQCTKAPLDWRLTRRRAALVVWLRGAHHLQFPGASSLPADGTVRPRDARCRGWAAHVLGGLRQPGRQPAVVLHGGPGPAAPPACGALLTRRLTESCCSISAVPAGAFRMRAIPQP